MVKRLSHSIIHSLDRFGQCDSDLAESNHVATAALNLKVGLTDFWLPYVMSDLMLTSWFSQYSLKAMMTNNLSFSGEVHTECVDVSSTQS